MTTYFPKLEVHVYLPVCLCVPCILGNPWISQLLVVLALVMMLNIDLALCGPFRNDLQRVKPAAFYNDCSKRYLRIRGKEVTADADEKHKLYMITLTDSHGFLLFDPTANTFFCWKKAKKNVQLKLTARRNPKDLSMCTFEELPVNGASTKYVSMKNKSQMMLFRANGSQLLTRRGMTKRRCQPESFIQDKNHFNETAYESKDEFCRRMKRIKHKHKMADEIKNLCGITTPVQMRKRRM
ncbi:uncharacterized protein LOC108739396 isoform X2 [Agrilus planipennis]|uniref:Uncharacterized protein LOC108739396 isoform X2 n=1 Tax=Agrilus planipennis TaxID=224129 RepID=A0A1W4WY23_AGRPL|nr:uncharacterized protein LOC108739396 isoform X2 [Agrilus planipennis]